MHKWKTSLTCNLQKGIIKLNTMKAQTVTINDLTGYYCLLKIKVLVDPFLRLFRGLRAKASALQLGFVQVPP